MLSEISLTKKDKHCTISHIHGTPPPPQTQRYRKQIEMPEIEGGGVGKMGERSQNFKKKKERNPGQDGFSSKSYHLRKK